MVKVKKRHRAEGANGLQAEPDERTADPWPTAEPTDALAEPDVKKRKNSKGWKPVQMEFDLMKEFETDGGLFIEEADDEEYAGVSYADLGLELGPNLLEQPRKLKGKKKQKKRHSDGSGQVSEAGQTAEELQAENAKLREQLEQAKQVQAKEALAKEEASAGDLVPEWVPYELHAKLLVGLSRLGFPKPTPVQARCLTPAVRQRKDIVAAAETGSGKTLAFGLPILHHILSGMESTSQEALGAGTASASSTAPAAPVPSQADRLLSALIILPTRELAVQVQSHINNVAQCTTVRSECVVGGMSIHKQKRLLGRHPYIVVGTPGRIFALLGLGNEAEAEKMDWFRNGVAGLKHLVLDEADRLVESGHFKELDAILAHVYASLARTHQLQTFVFSATLTMDPRSSYHKAKGGSGSDKVGVLMNRLKFRDSKSVLRVDCTKEETAKGKGSDSDDEVAISAIGKLPEKLVFREVVCSDDKEREAFLTLQLLRRYRWGPIAAANGNPLSGLESAHAIGGQIIIFVNAITSVLRLSSVLALLLESPSASKVLSRVRMSHKKGGADDKAAGGICVDVLGLHSRMKQKDRLKRMETFRKTKHAVLVCTDIAARGLDVPDVVSVLHYQAPRNSESFVHRSGRTARAGRSGESIAFMSPSDHASWGRLYRTVGISKENIQDIAPEAFEIGAAREASKLVADLEIKLHRASKEQADKSWLKRTADEAELMLDSEDEDKDAAKAAAPRHAHWGLYQQLQARTRRLPKRSGAAPLPRSGRKRNGRGR